MFKNNPGVREVLRFWAKASFVALTVFLVAFFVIFAMYSLAEKYDYNRTYKVSAFSERYVAPDKLTMALATVVKDQTPKAVQQRASEIIDATISEMKALGLTDDEIKTSGYNIYPEYEQRRWDSDYSEQLEIIGYTMNVEITIETKQIDKVSDILDKATSKGINQINSMYFSIENIEEIKDELKLEAIENAKVKAKKESKEAGLRLGKVINVDTQDGYAIYGNRAYDYSEKESVSMSGNEQISVDAVPEEAPVSTIPVNPGMENIKVTVELEYEIK